VFEPDLWFSGLGNCFFLPGNYETLLSGYKDGEEIYKYEYPVMVANDHDFLCFNWVDVTERESFSTGYTDIFAHKNERWQFATYQEMHDGIPSISLFIAFADNYLPSEKERTLLFDEICNLYGEPDYSEPYEEIEIVYNELFLSPGKDDLPIYIWLTDSSQIVMLDREEDFHRYSVYAEPVRK
jgi:hypothetical protein